QLREERPCHRPLLLARAGATARRTRGAGDMGASGAGGGGSGRGEERARSATAKIKAATRIVESPATPTPSAGPRRRRLPPNSGSAGMGRQVTVALLRQAICLLPKPIAEQLYLWPVERPGRGRNVIGKGVGQGQREQPDEPPGAEVGRGDRAERQHDAAPGDR